jgi:hypothetical protein
MSLRLLAIDLGKRSFHVHGIDSGGIIISRKISRLKLIGIIKELAPEMIAMEACASAHFWGRRFLAAGYGVLLINPRFVRPFVKGSKYDAADAEAFGPGAPIGLTFSVEPEWSRVGDGGKVVTSFAATTKILADTELVPDRLYAAFNANLRARSRAGLWIS